MLEDPKLQELARNIVHHNLPEVELEDVLTENFTSSEGKDALRITLVLAHTSVDEINGKGALKLLLGIRDGLADAGEERLPIIEYATADDLDGDEDQDD